ncbi:type II secretion system F family protein [Salinibaculum rarum]|uniref:type II secretion system F family protein n=1 Tax=Salinibaculum rarum TaxID=3058903 RepID=UPI00265F1138|nr:type II secretion system F family protein [Salinibaculum sp. KK48]
MSYSSDPTDASSTVELGEERDDDSTTEQSILLAVSELFYPVYQKFFNKQDRYVRNLEKRLTKANINRPVEIYVSGALAIGTFVGAILGLVLGGMMYFLLNQGGAVLPVAPNSVIPFSQTAWMDALIAIGSALKAGIAIVIAGGSGALFGLFGAIGVASFYPSLRIYSRRREINLVMPDVIAFMYSLSVGGMDQLEIFEAVADSRDTYGEAAVEFQRVTQEMKYFNTDYQTAVQSVANGTPSEDLSKFLVDMLSIINSGGDMSAFLENQKEYYMQEVRRKQRNHLDTLEFFGEMYMSLSILPMVLLIILIIMALLGNPYPRLLMLTVYGLLPLLNLLFGFIIAIAKQDTVGNGTLDTSDSVVSEVSQEGSITDLGVVDTYANAEETATIFNDLRSLELRHKIGGVIRNPWGFFTKNPLTTLWFTVPIAGLTVAFLIAADVASINPTTIKNQAFMQTLYLFYVPVFMTALPVAAFYEWQRRKIGVITDTLTEDLRKLANTNETGQPLLEAIRITGEDNPSLLGREFRNIYKRVKFGTSLSPVLVEFNNRYKIPRLARTVKLVQKAQEASSHITDVLQTAAEVSENQDELLRERVSRTRVQVVIIAVTFLVFLGVMLILQEFFVQRMVKVIGGSESSQAALGDFDSVDPAFLKMLYFHAAVIQGICAGYISGYMQTGKLHSGVKYMLAYMLVAVLIWGGVMALL